MLKINVDHLNADIGAANIVMYGTFEQLTIELAETTIEVLEKLGASLLPADREKLIEAFITEVYTRLIK